MLSNKLRRRIRSQFSKRADSFERSANWITSKALLNLHKELILNHHKEPAALDLCCGTGLVGAYIKDRVGNIIGLDLSPSMLAQARHRLTKVIKGNAEKLHLYYPVRSRTPQASALAPRRVTSNGVDLIICRQSLHFLDLNKLAREMKRILKPNGQVIISQTVPFNKQDSSYLHRIHIAKQPLLKNFVTEKDMVRLVENTGCTRIRKRTVLIRESITDWLKRSPELSLTTRQKVLQLYHQAPADYRKLHRLKIHNGKITEYWKWVIVSGIKGTA